jgi:hypothetical protein
MRLTRLFAVLLLAACSGDPIGVGSDDVRLSATIDATVPPPGSNLAFEVENLAPRTLYLLDHCGEMVTPWVERRVGGGWELVSSGVPCFAMATPPVELEPGATYDGTLPVHGPPGLYRLRLRVAIRPELQQEDVDVVYHEFTIGS